MNQRAPRVSGTREALVRAATGLYRRRGVGATSVADVCAHAGVTKGVFSYHFPGGRAELAVEVVEHNGADVQSGIAAAAATHSDPSAFVASLFDNYAELMDRKGSTFGCPLAACVVEGDGVSKQVRKAVRTQFAAWRLAMHPFFANDASEAGFDELVLATLEGGILVARAQSDSAALRRIGGSLVLLLQSHDGFVANRKVH